MFENREEAGRQLAEKLRDFKDSLSSVVLAIPRGGVVVGAEIARQLKLPLETVAVKKLGAPFNPELAIGAVGQGGVRYIDWDQIKTATVASEYLELEVEEKLKEVKDRIVKYQIRPVNLLNFKKFILTDDGIATGATTRAALKVIKDLKLIDGKPAYIVLAVPVIAKEVYKQIFPEVDRIVVLAVADNFGSVGQYYKKFDQVNDEDVIKIINFERRQT